MKDFALVVNPHAHKKHGPFTITIEIGPSTYHNMSRRAAKKWVRDMRDDLDRYARTYMAVGPYSKVVQTQVIEGESE